jgi:hypothetical protein
MGRHVTEGCTHHQLYGKLMVVLEGRTCDDSLLSVVVKNCMGEKGESSTVLWITDHWGILLWGVISGWLPEQGLLIGSDRAAFCFRGMLFDQ